MLLGLNADGNSTQVSAFAAFSFRVCLVGTEAAENFPQLP
jgi:hypothetical protein